MGILTPPHITSKIERNMHIFVKIFSPLQVVGIESPQKLSTYEKFLFFKITPSSGSHRKPRKNNPLTKTF